MATITNVYCKIETLELLVETAKKKGLKGIGLDLTTNDETNGYGQNAALKVAQSKEDREAKKPPFYVGNGAVKWINEKGISLAVKQEQPQTTSEPKANYGDAPEDDLPFI